MASWDDLGGQRLSILDKDLEADSEGLLEIYSSMLPEVSLPHAFYFIAWVSNSSLSDVFFETPDSFQRRRSTL